MGEPAQVISNPLDSGDKTHKIAKTWLIRRMADELAWVATDVIVAVFAVIALIAWWGWR